MRRVGRAAIGVVALCNLVACQAMSAARRPAPRGPTESDVSVYLDPLSRDQSGLAFEVSAVLALAADGREVPLEVLEKKIADAVPASQRLLAWGRAPRGDYVGLAIEVSRARLARPGKVTEPSEPPSRVKVNALFVADARSNPVIHLTLDRVESMDSFTPSFHAQVPSRTPPDLAGFISVPGAEALAIVDGLTHRVTGGLPLGGTPSGVALDGNAARAYVALTDRDEIVVVDVVAGVLPDRIRLRPGDAPTEVALTPSGSTLLAVNSGSNSVSFIDPKAGLEVGRAPTGLDPGPLVVDGLGQRAYVCNRGGSSLTVLDIPARAVAGTIATDPRPVSLRLDHTSSQLYVVQASSLYVSRLTLPQGTVSNRLFVGTGATWVEIDPRTNRLYVARGDAVLVYEPLMQLPMVEIPAPGMITRLQYSTRDFSLLAVVPSRSTVVVMDVASWRLSATMDVPAPPFSTAVPGGSR